MVRTLVFETSNPGSIPGNASNPIQSRWLGQPAFTGQTRVRVPVWESWARQNTMQQNKVQVIAKGSHRQDVHVTWGARLNCQLTAKQTKTLRLKIFRHSASQVQILPRVYALVCKRSKQVCYNVDSRLILSQMVTPQRSCSRTWFNSGEDGEHGKHKSQRSSVGRAQAF